MPYLVDSGILIRLVQRLDPQRAVVRDAYLKLKSDGEELLTAAQNVAEFWNVCTRPATARGGYGLSVDATARKLRILERSLRVITDTPAVYAEWKRLVTTHSVIGVQVHDARLVVLMRSHGITHVLTLNSRDFRRYSGIVVAVSPREVLRPQAPP
jgi:predicted nucleic acid-binding protein